MAKGQHRSDTPNLRKGTDAPKHGTTQGEKTAAIRVDRDGAGRLLGFGVGSEAGDGNYSR